MKIVKFDINLKEEQILHRLGCKKDTLQWDEWSGEYRSLTAEFMERVHPFAVLKFDTFKDEFVCREAAAGMPLCYCLSGLGRDIVSFVEELFRAGRYIRGLLADAMADEYLFRMDHTILKGLREECCNRMQGVKQRLMAPDGIPMEAQRSILTKCGTELGEEIRLTKHYMFDPEKTLGSIFLLSDKLEEFNAVHSCQNCSNTECSRRKDIMIEIRVADGGYESITECREGESIMDSLSRSRYITSALCGGRGICGKCGIRCIKGWLEVTETDRRFFTEKELNEGCRLACTAYPSENCTIQIIGGNESRIEAVSTFAHPGRKAAVTAGREPAGYLAGIDIGTTTLAFVLADSCTQASVSEYTALNRQRAYGADVITRILASNGGKRDELTQMIREDIRAGVNALLNNKGILPGQIRHLAVAGNTAMLHLLMGYSCETLGIYPFKPVSLDETRLLYTDWYPGEEAVPVTILPGISAYTGADIAAGLLACQFDQSDRLCMFVDIGTNAEMAIGDRSGLLCASAAAGPAFEGGNISRGTGSIPGAVSQAAIRQGSVVYGTIGGVRPPCGICGTGVIEIAAELLKAGIIDRTGLLKAPYFKTGFPIAYDGNNQRINIVQKDIRELQLAKSAIRSGIEILMKRYGVTAGRIDTVYIAGGFGYHMNMEKAAAIGLFPGEFSGKIQAVGNSSLKGALDYLTDPAAPERMKKLIRMAGEIHLSNDEEFNELYLNNMNF